MMPEETKVETTLSIHYEADGNLKEYPFELLECDLTDDLGEVYQKSLSTNNATAVRSFLFTHLEQRIGKADALAQRQAERIRRLEHEREVLGTQLDAITDKLIAAAKNGR